MDAVALLVVCSLTVLSLVFYLLTQIWEAGAKSSQGGHADLRRLHEQADVLLETLGLKADGQLPADVAKLAHAGQKIEAIKRYRELTGASLKDAKDAVEADEGLYGLEGKLERILRELHVTQAIRETSPEVKSAPDALDEIERLVRQDRLIDAIKTYRDVNGGGLREAKEAVEQIRLRQRNR